MEDVMVEAPDVLAHVDNGIGHITLNRAQALNALTTEMCVRIGEALRAWAQDDRVHMVMIDHAEGTRGFCAGGDIRRVAQSVRGDGRAADAFFAAEYRLIAQIKAFPKPYLAIMDGITMGGGAGLSVHGSHRIATDRTVFAMPETGIGLFPDVGGSWFLPRLKGELGTWLALTGEALKGTDVLAAGIATHYVSSVRLAELKQEIFDADLSGHTAQKLGVLLDRFSHRPMPPSYAEHVEVMNRCFGKEAMTDIVIALKMDDSDWALHQAQTLSRRSPLSMNIALRQLREGAAMTHFDDVMRMEYRIACRITRSHDFAEGVRAVLEDKDNMPHWDPISLCHVKPAMVEQMLQPFANPTSELQLG